MQRTRCLWGLLAVLCAGCGRDQGAQVVLYTSQDSIYLEGVLEPFERATGLEVLVRGDTEADKTVGLVQRLISERARPQADVFWNNEFANTIELAEAGLFAEYHSPAAADLPAAWRDPQGRFAGIAARLRVLIVHRARLAGRKPPTTWDELAAPPWRDEVIIARPAAGTTLTHVAALIARRGEEPARRLLESLAAVPLADGNGAVMRRVAAGEYTLGLTDTDDLHLALLDGADVQAVWLEGDSRLVIPSLVSVLAGAPHPEAARQLADYLLSPAVEQAMAAGRGAQLPLRPGLVGPSAFPPLETLVGASGLAPTDLVDIARALPRARALVAAIFER